ncbi:MAG: Hpt domain-containing protein [Deinococcales bacterium]
MLEELKVTAVLNPQQILELGSYQQGKDIVSELIQIFLQDAPNLMDELERAVCSQDAKAIYQAAHSLKGNAATLGLDQCTFIFKHIELLGRYEQLEMVDMLVEQAKGCLGRGYARLEQLLSNTTLSKV